MSDAKQVPILDLVLELGIARMPIGIAEAGANYVPRSCLWVEQRSGMIVHFELTEPLVDYVQFVLDSLGDLADRIGGVPRQIQLRDVKLAGGLKEVLEPSGIEIVVRESLPNLDNAIGGMMDFRGLGGGKRQPGILDEKGMTLDHLIAFAEAAKAFYEARLWNHLSDDDLLAIEPAGGPPGTQFAVVLGGGGQTFGIGFIASRNAHDLLRAGQPPRGGLWNILFGTIDELPFEDGEAWDRHDLPVADSDAYALLLHRSISSGKFKYPEPAQLVWAEGLLRALAVTTEEEIDAGRWDKQVQTLDGPATYKFSLPILLEQVEQPLQANPSLPPVEQAKRLMEIARDVPGRREIQIAHQALDLDPDSVSALMLLGTRAGDAGRAATVYQRATEAAERKLGNQMFENAAGHFWLIDETRPYMRARQLWASSLIDMGRFQEAASHERELLRLNPNDNQGNRYALAHALLMADMLDELDDLLNRSQYAGDCTAEWVYTRALVAFRQFGDSPESRQKLTEAQKQNPHVIPLLTGKRRMPRTPPPAAFAPGSEEQAANCVIDIRAGWCQTAGAIEWLEKAAKTRRSSPAKKAKSAKKRKPS